MVDASLSKNCCLALNDGQLNLKKSHNYYYQVQTAMFCTERKWCDFVVRTTIDLHVEMIQWDNQLWENVLRKLYFTALLPELAQPQQPSKGTIREPTDWGRVL